MTKSDLFKAAHKIARETKEIAGSYRIAFACALRDLYAGVAMTEKTVEEKLVEMGAEIWENYGYKRIYLNAEIVKAIGFEKQSSGKWCKNDQTITSADMNTIISRAFYDCNACEWNFKKCSGSWNFDASKAAFTAAI